MPLKLRLNKNRGAFLEACSIFLIKVLPHVGVTCSLVGAGGALARILLASRAGAVEDAGRFSMTGLKCFLLSVMLTCVSTPSLQRSYVAYIPQHDEGCEQRQKCSVRC